MKNKTELQMEARRRESLYARGNLTFQRINLLFFAQFLFFVVEKLRLLQERVLQMKNSCKRDLHAQQHQQHNNHQISFFNAKATITSYACKKRIRKQTFPISPAWRAYSISSTGSRCPFSSGLLSVSKGGGGCMNA